MLIILGKNDFAYGNQSFWEYFSEFSGVFFQICLGIFPDSSTKIKWGLFLFFLFVRSNKYFSEFSGDFFVFFQITGFFRVFFRIFQSIYKLGRTNNDPLND